MLVISAVVGVSASYVIVSNAWRSPTITVVNPPPPTKLPLVVSSPNFTTDQQIYKGNMFPWTVTITNPNTYSGYSYSVKSISVTVNDSVTKLPVLQTAITSFKYSLDGGSTFNNLTVNDTTLAIYSVTPAPLPADWTIPANGGYITIMFQVVFNTDGSYKATISALS